MHSVFILYIFPHGPIVRRASPSPRTLVTQCQFSLPPNVQHLDDLGTGLIEVVAPRFAHDDIPVAHVLVPQHPPFLGATNTNTNTNTTTTTNQLMLEDDAVGRLETLALPVSDCRRGGRGQRGRRQ